MRKVFATVVATAGAAFAPAVVFALILLALGRTEAFAILPLALTSAFFVALAHVVLLGLPTVWTLLRAGRFHFRTMLLSGFAIGFLPMAIWSWPYRPSPYPSSAWINGQQTLAEGIPTLAGWSSYLEGACYAGALGAVGAMAFYFMFKGMSPNNSFKPNPHRHLV